MSAGHVFRLDCAYRLCDDVHGLEVTDHHLLRGAACGDWRADDALWPELMCVDVHLCGALMFDAPLRALGA